MAACELQPMRSLNQHPIQITPKTPGGRSPRAPCCSILSLRGVRQQELKIGNDQRSQTAAEAGVLIWYV